MLSIVCLALYHPIPRFQRFLTSGRVLLRDKRHLILRDFAEVLASRSYCSCYCGEADTSEELVSARTRAAFYLLSQVDAVAIGVLRRCYAVGAKQHLGAAVLAVFSRFTERTRYTIDTGAPFNMCHVVSAMLYLLPT